MRHRELPSQVEAALAEHEVVAADLCLELTESAVMTQAMEGVRTLERLREIGVALSIDDFGTGYSSLSRLKRFPIDEIKIDRSFVTEVESDKDNAAIVTAVLAMGHGLGLRVVAEGVETPGQLAFLEQCGCDECQGFLFSRPLPAADFAALLRPDGLPVLAPAATVALPARKDP
jgi:EAL domain-containing protein (putative c-di-GMP-specific phosphodiesterase class I)